MSSSPFLSLPPELRHIIYEYYYTADDGYFLQPTTQKLAAANSEPIDLALMYTCRLIAYETRDLPLLYNKVTVSTVYNPELRPWAGRFDYLLLSQLQKQVRLVLVLGGWFLTDEMWVCIEQTFPWFVPQLRNALFQRQRGAYSLATLSTLRRWTFSDSFTYPAEAFRLRSYGLSALCEALDFTLRTIAHGAIGDFDRFVNAELEFWEYSGKDRLLNFLDKFFKPWDLPDVDVLAEIGSRFGDDHLWRTLQTWMPTERQIEDYYAKFRISAASAAIGWLNKLPVRKRICIRGLVIIEDYPSVGRQECHATGLVPFCKENPHLRISHQVSMLNVIFARALLRHATTFERLQTYARHEIGEVAFEQAISVSFSEIGNWLAEILSLPKAGMPDGSYTFTLDGEPIAPICSRIFQHIVLHKESLRITTDHSLLSLDEGTRLVIGPELHCGHDNASTQLVDNSSSVEANSDPGQLWNAEEMLAQFELAGVRVLFKNHSGEFDFELLRPPVVHNLPRLGALVMENYESRPYQPRPLRTCRFFTSPSGEVSTEPSV